MTEIEKDIHRFYELLQAHIIVAGGIWISEIELSKMTVKELLKEIYPNAIRLNVYAVIIKDGV